MIDYLGLVVYSVDKAKENGTVESITMSGKLLRDLTLSDSLDTILDEKGYKPSRPEIIDQNVIEFLIGGKIIIETIEGIRIKTQKETEVKFGA